MYKRLSVDKQPREADADGGAKGGLHGRVELAHDVVDLLVDDGMEGETAGQVDLVVAVEVEGGQVEPPVPAHEEPVEVFVAALGVGHEVRLVVERARPGGQPDGGEVACLTGEAGADERRLLVDVDGVALLGGPALEVAD